MSGLSTLCPKNCECFQANVLFENGIHTAMRYVQDEGKLIYANM